MDQKEYGDADEQEVRMKDDNETAQQEKDVVMQPVNNRSEENIDDEDSLF